MSLNILKLKQIDQKIQEVVFGYIRMVFYNHNNNQNTIPQLIFFICLLYYHEYDIFGPISKECEISGKTNNIITRNELYYLWVSAYGAQWIPSNTNNKYEWKMNYIKGDKNVIVGIVNNNHHCNTYQGLARSNSYTYLFYGSFNTKSTNMRCNEGDTITMILNLETSSLQFIVSNNKNNEVMSETINDIKKGENIKYRLGLSFAKCGINSLELVQTPNPFH